ncbi:MAG: hypothetical protein ABF276_08140 [Sulfurovum sp.]
MQYFLMYMWKLIYWVSGIVIVVGIFIMGMDISKMFIENKVLQLIVAIVMWIGGSFIVLKTLSMLDKLLEDKVSLDKDARLNFNVFVTFVLISIAVFFASIYTFNMWLALINDINRTLDDYFMIIFPIVLFIASIASFLGSFKLFKKYEETIKRKETL